MSQHAPPESESFADALTRIDDALRQMYAGRPEPFAALWSRSDDASLFGAFGPAIRGWHDLEPVFPWVAGRYRHGTVSIDYVAVTEGGGLACTVGYERAAVSIDGGPVEGSTIRATQVFRLEDGRWRLLHRHGDFTAPDGPGDEAAGR